MYVQSHLLINALSLVITRAAQYLVTNLVDPVPYILINYQHKINQCTLIEQSICKSYENISLNSFNENKVNNSTDVHGVSDIQGLLNIYMCDTVKYSNGRFSYIHTVQWVILREIFTNLTN